MELAQYATHILLHEPFEPMHADFSYEEVVEHLFDLLRTEPNVPHVAETKTIEQKRRAIRAYLNVRFPGDLYPRLLLLSDTLLQLERAQKNIVPETALPDFGVVEADITTLAVDAIVNAANDQLRGCFQPMHDCLDNIIHSTAGPQLRADCDMIMKLQGHQELVGHAKITRGYNLPSRYVIHTVGPNVAGAPLTPILEVQLANCYRAILDIASEVSDIRSIAFCSISTGVFAFPKVRAAEIAITTVKDWLAQRAHRFEKIVFTTFSSEDTAIYERLL
ncbi:protein-ADP-ribose hydrolase [Kurthia massiliensis]|uniref:protein-ADP-ribose hydrolase n=1 Tax=Kurthia massiliensis TaxID=1033739 RepID=UPI00028861A3|nr:protein-ADP-ribose hydrolase [Kurthia massiliensis]